MIGKKLKLGEGGVTSDRHRCSIQVQNLLPCVCLVQVMMQVDGIAPHIHIKGR